MKEGRALPLAEKQAALQVARARQLAEILDGDQVAAETRLPSRWGFRPTTAYVRRRSSGPWLLPASEEQAVQAALESNKELRKLQSQIASKGLEMRGEKAARWPSADLVAQYGMLAKFNNYAEFFHNFQRNNGQIGVSFQCRYSASRRQARRRRRRRRTSPPEIELNNTRNRISADLQQAFRDVKKSRDRRRSGAAGSGSGARAIDVDLAQMQEGRLALRQVEEARWRKTTNGSPFTTRSTLWRKRGGRCCG